MLTPVQIAALENIFISYSIDRTSIVYVAAISLLEFTKKSQKASFEGSAGKGRQEASHHKGAAGKNADLGKHGERA